MYCTARCSDEGRSFVTEVPDSPAAAAFKHIINGLYLALCLSAVDGYRPFITADRTFNYST